MMSEVAVFVGRKSIYRGGKTMDETEMLLKELTEASGIPGHEAEVRRLIRRHFELLGDVSHDRLGSLICKKGSEVTEPKVMLAAHMDWEDGGAMFCSHRE